MRVLFVLCAVAILSGCVGATLPVASQNATPVHQSKWRTGKYREAGDNTGLLLIKRDTGYRGSACRPLILINGEAVAPIDVGEKLELHLNAGRYTIRATPNSNCAANVVETTVAISEAATATYRLGFAKREMMLTPVAY